MDQEMIAYFDRRFDSVEQRFADLHAEMNRRFEQVDQRFEQIDLRFDQIDQRFEQIDQRFEQVDRRFEKLEETVRLTQVMVEGLRGHVCLLAEGVMGFSDQLEQRSVEVDRKLDELKALVGPVYKNLEQQTGLQTAELSRRVAVLEERAARETRDILEVIREKFGRSKAG